MFVRPRSRRSRQTPCRAPCWHGGEQRHNRRRRSDWRQAAPTRPMRRVRRPTRWRFGALGIRCCHRCRRRSNRVGAAPASPVVEKSGPLRYGFAAAWRSNSLRFAMNRRIAIVPGARPVRASLPGRPALAPAPRPRTCTTSATSPIRRRRRAGASRKAVLWGISSKWKTKTLASKGDGQQYATSSKSFLHGGYLIP